MLQIDVIPSVNEARTDDLMNKTVIVVDVLRATSTLITALQHGCKAVKPVETVCQAKQLQRENTILGGERFCKKINGFDYGNSPLEYMCEDVAEKTLVLTTTNGTRAIQKANKASHVLAGCLRNAQACARAAYRLKRDIVILCSGTNDELALEDGLCAGLLIEEIASVSKDPLQLNDLALAMRYAFVQVKEQITETLLHCQNGKKLTKMCLREDVLFCAELNQTSLVPILRGDKMVPLEF